jgi:hypothetical protein
MRCSGLNVPCLSLCINSPGDGVEAIRDEFTTIRFKCLRKEGTSRNRHAVGIDDK